MFCNITYYYKNDLSNLNNPQNPTTPVFLS